MQCSLIIVLHISILIFSYVIYNISIFVRKETLTCLAFEQNFAAQYDGAKGPDPGPGPMVRTWKNSIL